MKEQFQKKSGDEFLKTDGGKTKSNAIEVPSISLPKGGGAIKGIDEKFSVNSSNGTSSFSMPLPFSPNRNGFTPQLALSYNSGAGNSLFGIGWDLGLPSIQRRTDKKLPRYFDMNDVDQVDQEDSFMFSGVEELVPLLDYEADKTWRVRQLEEGDFIIRQYRPRIEGGFSRIERIYQISKNVYYWKVTSNANVTTFFGYSATCRIANPDNSSKIFQWLPEFSFDDKGSWVWYEYKKENLENIRNELYEKNRFTGLAPFANLHLSRIKYGNEVVKYFELSPYVPQLPINEKYFFELAFDYGEYDINKADELVENNQWLSRADAFSSYRSGFEIRTNRLCQRILMFHQFPKLNDGAKTLVRTIDFEYKFSNLYSSGAQLNQSNAEVTYLVGITQKGYVKNENTYSSKALPKMTFTYQELKWNKEITNVPSESLIHAPTGLSGTYQWVDLYNEGINGILSEQAHGWYYKSNLGQVQYDSDDLGVLNFTHAKEVMPKPSFTGLSNGVLQLQDLDANGEKQLVINAPGMQGYFELNDEDIWQPFKSFVKTLNIDLSSPHIRMMDVNGDGKPEVILCEEGAFWFWENEGKIGYDSPELAAKPYDEELGAAIVFSDPVQRIFLADMTGDGMTDIIRILNGEISYWPNLGYGCFGAKVTMSNAPVFDHPDLFNPAYLQLTDISGTGATDIIYLGKSKFSVYLNCSGNAWSNAEEIDPSFPTELPNRISVTDLLGNGTACIVWSSELPAYAQTPMRYIDLMAGIKPHIMLSQQNGIGKTTEVKYKSSTHYYIKDKLNGTPWLTKLPFPVQVVSQTIITEKVTNVRFTSLYTYHHGYYDHLEREFRGFGRVEQTDTEAFDVFEKSDASNIVPEEHHQPPVLNKTWFHTGAFFGNDKIISQYKNEYWKPNYIRNGHTTEAVEFDLPDASVLPVDHLINFDINTLSAQEWREALRSCKGMVLRQEVFGLDAAKRIEDEKKAKDYSDDNVNFIEFQQEAKRTELVPYNVAAHNYEIQIIQAQEKNKYATFIVKESEAITYNYERNPADPRIGHTINLETDELGNVLESVSIVYPRIKEEPILQELATDNNASIEAKRKSKAAQQKIWISYVKNDFTEDIIEPTSYYLRQNWQNQTYEITGITPLASIFKIDELKGKLFTLPEIEYHHKPTEGIAQKRLIEHIKTKFYNEELTAPLSDGLRSKRTIPFETYQLAFTPNLLNDIFSPSPYSVQFEITDADMIAAKYLNDNGNWWVQSGIVKFKRPGENFTNVKSRFFSPIGYRDAFDTETNVFYDGLHFFMEKAQLIVDKAVNVLNETKVLRFNYRTLSPDIMLDVNHNISSVIVDELGMLKAASIEGKAGANPFQGTEADNLNGYAEHNAYAESVLIQSFFDAANTRAPHICDYTVLQTIAHQLLGNASTRLVYDFNRQPCVAASIVREQHSNVNVNSPLQISFEYSDGLGKVAMKKVQAEPGEVKQPDGSIVNTRNQLRWIGNGRTVLNNKGNPIKQYEPYFSTTPAYEDDSEWVEQGVSPIIYYDGAGRNVRTEMPNGTFSKVVFDVWKQLSYDPNDTVMDSAWYKERITLPNDVPEKTAAKKTEMHYETPAVMLSDTLGRPILNIEHNKRKKTNSSVTEEFYTTYAEIDIEGNLQYVIDAKGNTVMSWRYDMLGHQLAQTSMDAGKRWMLNDAGGKAIKSWDERQHEFQYVYDEVQRPIFSKVVGGEDQLNNIFDKVFYGDATPNAIADNLKGQVIKHYDTGGKISSPKYNFKGQPKFTTRRLFKDYKAVVNWEDDNNLDVNLETQEFTFTTETDALGRITKQTAPDNSIITPIYNESGLLYGESVNHFNLITNTYEGNKEYIKNINYNEKRLRNFIKYGNGVKTVFEYDNETFRLAHLKSNHNMKVLQDLYYTYDPVGNITLIKDDAHDPEFFSNQIVEPNSSYTYDALYRLIEATGRENSAALSFGNDDNWNDEPFMHENPMAVKQYMQCYHYDAVGNIEKMKHDAVGNSWIRNYEYETTNNRLKTTQIGSQTYLYPHHEKHGFITQMPHLQDMRWNFKEELVTTAKQKVNPVNGTAETTYYQYDGQGQRLRKITENSAQAGAVVTKKDERIYISGFETYRKYQTNAVDFERTTLSLMDEGHRFVMVETVKQNADPTSVITERAGARLVRYQLHNHLGSAALELDNTAAVISYEEYHPYGTTAYQTKNRNIRCVAKRYRYTGMERDEETGLEYHSARYYLPWLGRWLSSDPIGISDGLNVFRYCKDEPTAANDTTGLQSKKKTAEEVLKATKAAKASNSLGMKNEAINNLIRKYLSPGDEFVSQVPYYNTLPLPDDLTIAPGSQAARIDQVNMSKMIGFEDKARSFSSKEWQIAPGKINYSAVSEDATNIVNHLEREFFESGGMQIRNDITIWNGSESEKKELGKFLKSKVEEGLKEKGLSADIKVTVKTEDEAWGFFKRIQVKVKENAKVSSIASLGDDAAKASKAEKLLDGISKTVSPIKQFIRSAGGRAFSILGDVAGPIGDALTGAVQIGLSDYYIPLPGMELNLEDGAKVLNIDPNSWGTPWNVGIVRDGRATYDTYTF
jgi:RHS repeat-associated protein